MEEKNWMNAGKIVLVGRIDNNLVFSFSHISLNHSVASDFYKNHGYILFFSFFITHLIHLIYSHNVFIWHFISFHLFLWLYHFFHSFDCFPLVLSVFFSFCMRYLLPQFIFVFYCFVRFISLILNGVGFHLALTDYYYKHDSKINTLIQTDIKRFNKYDRTLSYFTHKNRNSMETKCSIKKKKQWKGIIFIAV